MRDSTRLLTTILIATILPAAQSEGGWFAFGEPGSAGQGLVWLNRAADLKTVETRMLLDPGLGLPAVRRAVVAGGSPRFRLEGRGEFIVEVYVQLVARTDASLALVSDGRVLDARLLPAPLRMYPGSKERRTWALSGVVQGGAEFALESTYPDFLLVAARWTPREEFERTVVPKLVERLRRMAADPYFEQRRSARAPRLRELGDLALHSSQKDPHREGLLGAARGAYWKAAEDHEPRDMRLVGELLDRALKEMPEHPIVRQMASAACLALNTGSIRGMPCTDAMRRVAGVRWEPADRTDVSGAPRWAAAQWRLRARMEDLTRYWVRERQRDNGELAGGWDDDVEILRQWGPMAMGLGSAVAAEGTRRVALGVWESGILKDGYMARIRDVEHSSEPTSDTLGLLAALDPTGEETRGKLKIAAACADNWIARQPDGMWRFRSSWFNCREHDPAPERAVDVHLNTRAMGPALWHAWLSRDERLIALIEHWGESWLAAMHATENAKPRGMVPAALHSADGNYLLGATWDKPDVEWDYFQWSRGAQESIAHLFRALAGLTGKAKWTEAAGEAFAAVGMQAPDLPAAAEEEALLERLSSEMERVDARLSVNFDMHTREAIYTDRVYYPLPAALLPHLFGGGTPRGDRAPDFAVTWPECDTRFARLLMAASETRLEARLFSFERQPGEARIRLWRLEPGAYRWQAGGRSGRITVTRRPAELTVPLEPRREVRMVVEPEGR